MRTIHRIWIGDPMPERYQEYGQLWKELNPGYLVHDWTEEEVMDGYWENSAVLAQMYKESKQPGADMVAYYTHVADVVDYELVWKFGGYYVNTDVLPLRPLSHLQQDYDNVGIAMEDDRHIVNMAMYSKPYSSFFADVIETLPQRYFSMPGAGMHNTTGVGLLMQVWQRHPYIQVWPKEVFNSLHWSSIAPGTYPHLDSMSYPDCAVGLHGWSHKEYMRGHEILPH